MDKKERVTIRMENEMAWGESESLDARDGEWKAVPALLDDALESAGAQRQAKKIVHPEEDAVGDVPAGLAQASVERADEHAHGNVDALHAIVPPGSRSGKHRHLAEVPLRREGAVTTCTRTATWITTPYPLEATDGTKR